MKKEDMITEITSLLKLIDETHDRIGLEYDKFQVALTNTLRLMDGTSSTLSKLKGDTEDLKGYLIKTSMEMRDSITQPYH